MFNKKFSLSTLLTAVIVAIVLTFQITFVSMRESYRFRENQTALDQSEQAAKLDMIKDILADYCIYDVDTQYSSDMALTAFLAMSGDPYAYYYSPEAYAALLQEDNGNNVGIGIIITDNEKGLQVLSVSLGSPAEEVGILGGDIITAINQTSFADKDYNEKTNLLLGKENETITLTLLRGKETKSVTVTRKAYESPTVIGKLLPDGKTALIRIEQFNNTTFKAFKELTSDLVKQGAQGFVYDLRGNPGGSLDAIVPVLDYLLPEGKLLTLEDKAGNTQSYDSDKNRFDYPAIILVNDTTASAAELFAACMRDFGAAKLLGETTYGKGVAQSFVPLPDGSAIKFTSYLYYSPVTKNYDGVGLKPDITVKTPEDLTDFAHTSYETDPQMQEAVKTLWK